MDSFNELFVAYICVYTLAATLLGVLATFFISTDTVVIKDMLFGEGHSKESALRKINMVTNLHFGLLLISAVTIMYWEGYV